MTTLLHIAPQLPPAFDGVGDYCWNLWKHWPDSEPNWQFLVARGGHESAAHWPQVAVSEFDLNRKGLHEALERAGAETVVLHYVGYGFQPKGIPLWLPRSLSQWRLASDRRRLVTMFHEMYARSSPWRSPFWVAPLARGIIRKLVATSDAWVTSCERYFTQLTREFSADARRGGIIPIGSNIPRATATPLPAERLRIAVFGLARTRLWALERHCELLRTLVQSGAIERITLIGQPSSEADERELDTVLRRIGGGVEWERRFALTPDEIASALASHQCGLLANEPDILTKSGVFAAFATNGVVPVVSTPRGERLPASLEKAVLRNDEKQLIATTAAELVDPRQLQARAEALLTFARNELDWSRIGLQWLEILQQATGSTRVSAPSHRALTARKRVEVAA